MTYYPEDNAIIVEDPRIFKGVLIVAKTWGSMSLGESSSGSSDEIDELMAEFVNKTADLRAKYEVTGDLLNGESAVENDYYDELNKLLTMYRTLLFETAI